MGRGVQPHAQPCGLQSRRAQSSNRPLAFCAGNMNGWVRLVRVVKGGEDGKRPFWIQFIRHIPILRLHFKIEMTVEEIECLFVLLVNVIVCNHGRNCSRKQRERQSTIPPFFVDCFLLIVDCFFLLFHPNKTSHRMGIFYIMAR